jgi:hypothetical protein
MNRAWLENIKKTEQNEKNKTSNFPTGRNSMILRYFQMKWKQHQHIQRPIIIMPTTTKTTQHNKNLKYQKSPTT